MVEKDIVITKRTPLSAKTGKPYVKVQTQTGNFFCWEPKLYPYIPEVGKITILYEQKRNFSNIMDIFGASGRVEVRTPIAPRATDRSQEIIDILKRIERKIDGLELADPNGQPPF